MRRRKIARTAENRSLVPASIPVRVTPSAEQKPHKPSFPPTALKVCQAGDGPVPPTSQKRFEVGVRSLVSSPCGAFGFKSASTRRNEAVLRSDWRPSRWPPFQERRDPSWSGQRSGPSRCGGPSSFAPSSRTQGFRDASLGGRRRSVALADTSCQNGWAHSLLKSFWSSPCARRRPMG